MDNQEMEPAWRKWFTEGHGFEGFVLSLALPAAITKWAVFLRPETMEPTDHGLNPL